MLQYEAQDEMALTIWLFALNDITMMFSLMTIHIELTCIVNLSLHFSRFNVRSLSDGSDWGFWTNKPCLLLELDHQNESIKSGNDPKRVTFLSVWFKWQLLVLYLIRTHLININNKGHNSLGLNDKSQKLLRQQQQCDDRNSWEGSHYKTIVRNTATQFAAKFSN